MRKRDYGIKKSIDVNIAVVDETLQVLEVELNHLRPDLNPVDEE